MRQLMISLDKKILDPASAAAKRMVEYGKENELYVVIPASEKITIDLSSRTHVIPSGGTNKITQLFNLYKEAKKICSQNLVDSVTTQDPFFMGLIGLCLKKKFKLPLEVQMHGDFFGGYYKQNMGWFFRLVIARNVLKKSDTVRTVGERVKQSLLKIGVNENKIIIRPVTLNTNSNETLTSVQGEKSFVWAGRMEPEKNLPFLIDVFKEVIKQKNDALLILVGEGSQRSLLEQKVNQLILEKNITFTEWLPSPFKYIKNAQALLLPSLTESYAAVVMEAYAAGTPVIISDVGVANYELKPGPKVTVLPINDKDAWVEAILKV